MLIVTGVGTVLPQGWKNPTCSIMSPLARTAAGRKAIGISPLLSCSSTRLSSSLSSTYSIDHTRACVHVRKGACALYIYDACACACVRKSMRV